MDDIDSLIEQDLIIDMSDLIEFSFPELSILFDSSDMSSWVEFPDDTQDDIDLESPTTPISEETLSRLPKISIDGSLVSIDMQRYLSMKEEALKSKIDKSS